MGSVLSHYCTNNVDGILVVTHMVRLRSNRRTSAEAESNKDGNQVKGNGEDYLESLPVIKNVKATKTASTNVTPSNIAGKNNDNPSQPLFMKDAKILDAASLHSGTDDIGSKRRRVRNNTQPIPPKVNPVLEVAAMLETQPAMEDGRFYELKRAKLKGKQRLAFSHAGEEHAQRDMAIVKMRGYLQPNRFYKTLDSVSTEFQMGTVKSGAMEGRQGRVSKREQRSTIADEILADSGLRAYRKRKMQEIQEKGRQGKKRHVAQKKAKRQPKWLKFASGVPHQLS